MTLPRSLLAAITDAVLDPANEDDDELVDDLLDEWELEQPRQRHRRDRDDEGVW